MSETSNLKAVAQAGFAFGAAYNTHRPSYPDSITKSLLGHVRLGGSQNARVLDLAAGTGKFTELIAARDEQYDIVAVEPHDDMRRVLEEKNLPRTKVLKGSAEEIPLDDESVDAVIVAQAFHWFAHIDALREIHRVLVPHGAFGMIWNIDDYNSPRAFQPRSAWEAKLHDLIWQFDDDEPRFRHEKWRSVFDEQIRSTPLSIFKASDQYFALPLGESHEDYEAWLGKEQVWERIATLSQIVVLDEAEKAKVKSLVMEAMDDETIEIDERGQVKLHGRTYIAWTTNIPEDGRENLTTVEKTVDQ